MSAAPRPLISVVTAAVATVAKVANQHQDRDQNEEPIALQELAHSAPPSIDTIASMRS
jgi:hypothetical protein